MGHWRVDIGLSGEAFETDLYIGGVKQPRTASGIGEAIGLFVAISANPGRELKEEERPTRGALLFRAMAEEHAIAELARASGRGDVGRGSVAFEYFDPEEALLRGLCPEDQRYGVLRAELRGP